jgi:hypothetical protein
MVKSQPLGTVLLLVGAMTFVPHKGRRTSPAQARRAGKAIARSVRAGKVIMCEPQEAREGRQGLVPNVSPSVCDTVCLQ